MGSTQPAVKPYNRPTLTTSGKVRELTAGGSGAMVQLVSGGMGPMMGINRKP